MNQIKLAKEYAKALFFYANQTSQIQKEMEALDHLDDQSIEKLKAFLGNPFLDKSKKIEFAHLFFANFSENFIKFVDFLIELKKESLLFHISYYYKEFFYESNHIEKIFFTSTFALKKELRNEIENQLQVFFGPKKYLFDYSIDPSLIGGAIIQKKDKRWDFSFKKKLKDLKRLFNT